MYHTTTTDPHTGTRHLSAQPSPGPRASSVVGVCGSRARGSSQGAAVLIGGRHAARGQEGHLGAARPSLFFCSMRENEDALGRAGGAGCGLGGGDCGTPIHRPAAGVSFLFLLPAGRLINMAGRTDGSNPPAPRLSTSPPKQAATPVPAATPPPPPHRAPWLTPASASASTASAASAAWCAAPP